MNTMAEVAYSRRSMSLTWVEDKEGSNEFEGGDAHHDIVISGEDNVGGALVSCDVGKEGCRPFY